MRRFCACWFAAPRMLAAQLGVIEQSLVAGLAGCFLASLVVASTLYSDGQGAGVFVWSGLIGLLCLLGGVGRLALPDRLGETGCRHYAWSMTALLVAIGGAWGALTPLWMDFRTILNPLTIIATTAGMNAAALALFSLCRPVAIGFVLTSVLPVWGWFLLSGQPEAVPMSIAAPLFLGMMLLFSHRNALSMERALELNFENLDLLQQIREQMQQTQAAQRRAEEADKAKSVILASASHDLRQPLHALGLFLVALQRSTLHTGQRELLAHAQTSALAAQEMLDTLLDFSRLDAGVIVPRQVPFSLQALLYKLERELAAQAEARGLVYRSRDSALHVCADPELVELIMRNLVNNAIRYTERGGILIGARMRGEQVLLEVWDTGIGIAPEQQGSIFKAFHQIDNPQRDRMKGLGLGLAIVEGLALAMGARVTLASAPGRGSVFRLALPLGQPQPPAAAQAKAADSATTLLAGCRVLVIDDDAVNCLAMSAMLRSLGAICHTSEEIDEALALLDQGFEPEVIIADYRLRNHQTGYQAIQTLCAALDETPLSLIVTGDTAPERIREALSSGIPLLHKPVGEAALLGALGELMQRLSAHRAKAKRLCCWSVGFALMAPGHPSMLARWPISQVFPAQL